MLSAFFIALAAATAGFILPQAVAEPHISWIMASNPAFYAFAGILKVNLIGRQFDCDFDSPIYCLSKEGSLLIKKLIDTELNVGELLLLLVAVYIVSLCLSVAVFARRQAQNYVNSPFQHSTSPEKLAPASPEPTALVNVDNIEDVDAGVTELVSFIDPDRERRKSKRKLREQKQLDGEHLDMLAPGYQRRSSREQIQVYPELSNESGSKPSTYGGDDSPLVRSVEGKNGPVALFELDFLNVDDMTGSDLSLSDASQLHLHRDKSECSV